MLSTIFARLLNLAIELNSQVTITELEGKSFGISINEFPQDIAISVEKGRFVVAEISEVDVSLSGDIKTFIAMLQNESSIDNEDLFINGKIASAKKFQQVLSQLSIDWEAFFAKFLPQDIAQKGADALNQGVSFAQQSGQKLTESLRDYIVNDKQLLVSRVEFESLQTSITNIGQRIDALILHLSPKLDK